MFRVYCGKPIGNAIAAESVPSRAKLRSKSWFEAHLDASAVKCDVM
jgi:hypothetical protein